MRNLFPINVKTKEHGFEGFLMRKSENMLKARYDENVKLVDGKIKKILVPFVCLWSIALLCGIICIKIFLDKLSDSDFAQAYSTVGWAFYGGIAGIALFVILAFAAILWMRKFMANPQTQNLFQEQQKLKDKIARGLCVPEDSAEIDVMCRPYKLKKGKEKYQNKQYINLPMWIFTEDGNLCFADTIGVWAVPLSCIISIAFFPGHATLTSWNKEEKYNSSKYKKTVRVYKHNYIVKGYYSLQTLRNNEEWEVLIPVYDIDYIFELTGKYPAV